MKIDTPILRRLGPVPFWRGERKCLEGLEDAYRRARDAAARLLPPDDRRGSRRAAPSGGKMV